MRKIIILLCLLGQSFAFADEKENQPMESSEGIWPIIRHEPFSYQSKFLSFLSLNRQYRIVEKFFAEIENSPEAARRGFSLLLGSDGLQMSLRHLMFEGRLKRREELDTDLREVWNERGRAAFYAFLKGEALGDEVRSVLLKEWASHVPSLENESFEAFAEYLDSEPQMKEMLSFLLSGLGSNEELGAEVIPFLEGIENASVPENIQIAYQRAKSVLDFLCQDNILCQKTLIGLLEESPLLNIQFCGDELDSGVTILMTVAMRRDLGVEHIQKLLDRGANPNFRTYSSWSALGEASTSEGKYDVVKALIEGGADPRVHTDALSNAVQEENFEVVKLLLDSGADPNSASYGLPKATERERVGHHSDQSIQERKGSLPTSIDFSLFPGETPFAVVVRQGDIETVDSWINRAVDPVDPNFCEKGPWASLPLEMAWGSLEIAQKLIDAGANVNAKNSSGDMVLSNLVKNSLLSQRGGLSESLDVFRLLLDNGADVDSEDHWGVRPLDWFVRMFSLDTKKGHWRKEKLLKGIKLCLEHGADPDPSSIRIGTINPLLVCQEGGMEEVRVLLEEAIAKREQED